MKRGFLIKKQHRTTITASLCHHVSANDPPPLPHSALQVYLRADRTERLFNHVQDSKAAPEVGVTVLKVVCKQPRRHGRLPAPGGERFFN